MAVPVEVNSFGIFKSIFRTWLRFRGIFFQYEVVARRVWAVWNWVKWVWYQDPFPFDFYVQKWKLESQHHPLLFRRKWPIGEYQKNDWLWLYLWLSNKTRDTCSSTERTRKGRRIEEPDVVSNDGVIDISAIEREREREGASFVNCFSYLDGPGTGVGRRAALGELGRMESLVLIRIQVEQDVLAAHSVAAHCSFPKQKTESPTSTSPSFFCFFFVLPLRNPRPSFACRRAEPVSFFFIWCHRNSFLRKRNRLVAVSILN